MTRPKLYKSNNIWYCEHKNIKAEGQTPIEAFVNYFLQRASANLHEDETRV
jgi:hypothetical protein